MSNRKLTQVKRKKESLLEIYSFSIHFRGNQKERRKEKDVCFFVYYCVIRIVYLMKMLFEILASIKSTLVKLTTLIAARHRSNGEIRCTKLRFDLPTVALFRVD